MRLSSILMAINVIADKVLNLRNVDNFIDTRAAPNDAAVSHRHCQRERSLNFVVPIYQSRVSRYVFLNNRIRCTFFLLLPRK